MTLLVLLLFSCISNILMDTTRVPFLGMLDRKNINTKSVQNILTERNLTPADSYVNITGTAIEFGYVIEEHKVTTEDGYILHIHRLTRDNCSDRGIPVFLMHGLFDSSDSWLLQGPSNAFGYLLADQGFDVWMGNARGNKYSTAHTSLTAKEERFWKFSWEEIGLYDLPAMIDCALATSGRKRTYYVGYSQGTTSFFVMSSLKPYYKTKIVLMFALSPVAWLSHADSPIFKYLSSVPAAVLEYLQLINTFSSVEVSYEAYANLCKLVTTGCSDVFEMLFGKNYFVSDAMLPVIVKRASGSSVLQLIHYWQLHHSGRFCRFDYGWSRNMLEYGTATPPDYELSDVTTPIVTFYSGNDRLSSVADVSTLHEHLPNVYKTYYTQYFSHIDYMYAGVAREAVYVKIINDIHNYVEH